MVVSLLEVGGWRLDLKLKPLTSNLQMEGR